MDEESLKLLHDIALIDQQLQIESTDAVANLSLYSRVSEPSTSSCTSNSSTPSEINNTCQELLRTIEKRILELLDENKKEQQTLLGYLDNSNKKFEEFDTKVSSNTLKKIKCAGIPYFKDCHCYPQPRNEAVQSRIANGELCCTDYFTKCHIWSKYDKKCLKEAVLKMCKENIQIPKNASGTNHIQSNVITNQTVSLSSNKAAHPIDWLKISVTDLGGKYSAEECKSKWTLHLSPEINKSKWTEDETEELNKLAQKYNFEDWDTIAKKLDTKRTGFQCCIKYQAKNSLSEGKWSATEDEYLIFLIDKFKINQYIPWRKISWFYQTRSTKQCKERYEEHLVSTLKRGPFSLEEDKIILSGIKLFKDFGKISRFLPGRVATQIRSRFYYLAATATTGFTKEEDSLLISLAKKYPNKWKKISSHFKNRSSRECRNRHAMISQPESEMESMTSISQLIKPRVKKTKPFDSSKNNTKGKLPTIEKNLTGKKRKRTPTPGSEVRNEILNYFQTCSQNLFGPRMRHPSSEEELNELSLKLRATMEMLSVSCLSLSKKIDIINSLKNDSNFDSYDIKMLRHLSDEVRQSDSLHNDYHFIRKMLIPPNYNTLTGLDTLLQNRQNILQRTCEAEGLPLIVTKKDTVDDDRIYFSNAKLLFQSRLRALFLLPMAMTHVSTNDMNIQYFHKPKTKRPKTLSKKRRREHAKYMVAIYHEKRKLLKERNGTNNDDDTDESFVGLQTEEKDNENPKNRKRSANENVCGSEESANYKSKK